MELLAAFPDAEDVGLALFESAGPTVLATPVELEPPLIVVRRVGGGDTRITDQPRLQVQVYGATRLAARDLAEECRQLVLAAPATVVAGVVVDKAFTESGPVFVDYGVPGIHRYISTYRLEYRRPR
jgi:hypothetical protein